MHTTIPWCVQRNSGIKHPPSRITHSYIRCVAYFYGINLMSIQRVPLLHCSCGEHIALPQQSTLGKVVGPTYQPLGRWPFVFACPHCGKLSQHFAQDIRLEAIEAQVPRPFSVVLWGAEFKCVHKNCGKLFCIFTTHKPTATAFEVTKAIFSASPSPTCGSDGNHGLTFPVEPVRVFRVG